MQGENRIICYFFSQLCRIFGHKEDAFIPAISAIPVSKKQLSRSLYLVNNRIQMCFIGMTSGTMYFQHIYRNIKTSVKRGGGGSQIGVVLTCPGALSLTQLV